MPSTTARIVFSRATGRIRSVVIPDSDSQAISRHPGEDVLVVPLSTYQTLVGPSDVQAYVTQQTGLVPTNDRAVMVDSQGFVLGEHFVDPACGDVAFAGASLAFHSSARRGWVRIGGKFFGLPEFPEKARRKLVKRRLRSPK